MHNTNKRMCSGPIRLPSRSSVRLSLATAAPDVGLVFFPPLRRAARRPSARTPPMIHGRGWEAGALRGEEIDRLGRGDRLDVLGLELEQQHALDQLLLELRIAELRRHDLAERDVAVGRDR